MSWQVQKRKHGRLGTGVREIKLGGKSKKTKKFSFFYGTNLLDVEPKVGWTRQRKRRKYHERAQQGNGENKEG